MTIRGKTARRPKRLKAVTAFWRIADSRPAAATCLRSVWKKYVGVGVGVGVRVRVRVRVGFKQHKMHEHRVTTPCRDCRERWVVGKPCPPNPTGELTSLPTPKLLVIALPTWLRVQRLKITCPVHLTPSKHA